MVVLNRMSRYHLVVEALRRARRTPEHGSELAEHCRAMLDRHHSHVREHLEDMPEVREWIWRPWEDGRPKRAWARADPAPPPLRSQGTGEAWIIVEPHLKR